MKQKSHSGAKKRFKVTRRGKVMAKKRNRAHLLEKKTSARKRRLAGTKPMDEASAKRAKKLLGE